MEQDLFRLNDDLKGLWMNALQESGEGRKQVLPPLGNCGPNKPKGIEMEKKVFFGDWEEGGRFQMIADFTGTYMDAKEFLAAESPYKNTNMWMENKAKMAAALEEPRFEGEILFAAYTYQDYSGDAFVLLRRDGKLYEVNGGHCSCYGLGESGIGEGSSQWEPEETTKEALLHRLDAGSCWGILKDFSAQIRSAVEAVDA